MSPPWLVFGLSGQVGDAVREQGQAGDPGWLAYSRHPHADHPGLAWQRGELWTASVTEPVAAILCLGPLDLFADWFAQSPLMPARVVALGSTSVHSKLDSPDDAERALAQRLREAEARLAAAAQAKGSALAVLRPTLIYGRGRDRSLSRLVALARRWRVLALPQGSRGIRQPVHADDVAAAALACLRAPEPVRGSFDLPGAESLPFQDMVRRALAVGAPQARLVLVPDRLFRWGLLAARRTGLLADAGEGVLSRLGRDLVADASAATKAFGYRPRAFVPDRRMFMSDVAAQHEIE